VHKNSWRSFHRKWGVFLAKVANIGKKVTVTYVDHRPPVFAFKDMDMTRNRGFGRLQINFPHVKRTFLVEMWSHMHNTLFNTFITSYLYVYLLKSINFVVHLWPPVCISVARHQKHKRTNRSRGLPLVQTWDPRHFRFSFPPGPSASTSGLRHFRSPCSRRRRWSSSCLLLWVSTWGRC
jgi:hypothetical protein